MRGSNTKILKKSKLLKISLVIVILLAVFLTIREIKKRYHATPEPSLQSFTEINKVDINPVASPQALIIKDLADNFIFTFPPGSFLDYHGQIETTVFGRHGHDFDQRYRFVQDVLIIAGSMRQPIEVELSKPFEVKATFNPTYMKHIDQTKLVMLYTHDSPGSKIYPWITLPTTIDQHSNSASAMGTQLGNYVLVGPLICPEDKTEFDDNYDASNKITRSNFDKPIKMIFDVPADENWLNFIAHENKSYKLETTNLTNNVKPLIDIYDNGGVDKLITLSSNNEWTPPQELFRFSQEVNFFISVRSDPTSSTGCNAKFDFKLSEI